MAKERSDVAELAVVGAAAGELDIHRAVAREVEQVPARDGGLLNVWEGIAGVDARGVSAREISQEEREGDLGLAEDEVVDRVKLVRFAGKERATGDDGDAEVVAARDDVLGGLLLDDHSAEKDIVGPEEVLVGELGDVHIDQLELPVLGEHGGDGEQAKWRCAGLFADELESVLEAPKGVGEFGMDEQYFH